MLQLGPIKLDFPVVQAALAGYSDGPMRLIARRHGAPYALHEVVLDKLIIQPGKLRKQILTISPEDHPIGGQIMGAEPVRFAEAAAAMCTAGFDVIDINFGCPVKKVLGKCRGGYLLSDPPTAIEILRRVRDAVPSATPVTLKMRRGMDDSAESEANFFRIFDAAYELGLAAVTVHGRTVQQRYVGPSKWEFLKRVKRHAGDGTVLGSGDLFTPQDIVRMMEETGVDGVTVARGCIGNPWIFEQTRRLMESHVRQTSGLSSDASNRARSVCEGPSDHARIAGPLADARGSDSLFEPPGVVEQGRVIREHFELAVEVYGEEHAARLMRKFGIKYSELHPDGLKVRAAFVGSRSAAEWRAVLDTWYDPTRDWPPGVPKGPPRMAMLNQSEADIRAGRTQPAKPALKKLAKDLGLKLDH